MSVKRMAIYELETVHNCLIKAMNKYAKVLAMKKKHAAKAYAERIMTCKISKKSMALQELEIAHKVLVKAMNKYKETLAMSEEQAGIAWANRSIL